MHFKLAYLKLTFFYVLVVMLISISFSISLYRISSQEINKGFGRQVKFLKDFQVEVIPQNSPLSALDNLKTQLINESNHRLVVNLVYFNLLILFVSSGLGYFFSIKSLEPIKKSVEAQSCFTADASHELRTPLTALRSEIEVNLRNPKMSLSDAKNILRSNLEEIDKLQNLSAALLKLAQNEEHGKDGVKLDKINLEEVLIEAFEKIELLAAKKEIGFENNLSKLFILGDRQSLVELFVILLDNAIKYSPEKSKIGIQMLYKDHRALISIKDNGVGIKSSDLPFIFNRFYRADNSRNKEKVNGYGLGLSIAKQIIDLNKGTINVESIPGKGTTFTLKFKIFS